MLTRRRVFRGAVTAVPALFLMALASQATGGDEPGRLGRFFRFVGGGGNAAPAAAPALPARPSGPDPLAAPAPERPLADDHAPPPGVGVGAVGPPAGTVSPAAPAPRLVPQPRTYHGVTDSDPIATRVTIGRSDDGRQFGMFLQVFADGMVVDSDGVHRAGRAAVQPLINALESGDLYRLRGHCGGPPTDFVEHVQVVVYERSLGRLRANAFSFSGNPHGCDPGVRRLQAALDTIQARVAGPVAAPDTPAAGPASVRTPAPGPVGVTAAAPPSPPALTPPAITPAPGPATIRLNEGAGPATP